MSDEEDRIITPNDAREEVGHKPLTEDDTLKAVEPLTLSDRYKAAKKFCQDNAGPISYGLTAAAASAATIVITRNLRVRGVQDAVGYMISDIKMSTLEAEHASKLASTLAEFIDIKKLGSEYVEMFGVPEPLIFE